jgi:phosphoesterase RecJ-like protein
MILDKIIEALEKAEKIVILPHISADGDAIGSCLALAAALEGMGKKVKVVLEEDIPFIYRFLPRQELAEVYTVAENSYDVAVALDTGDLGRLGSRKELFERGNITVNIDHHSTNSEFAFYNFVQPSSSAVGEIVYQMIKMMGIDLEQDTATCLYTAIATDTGGFRFSNTTSLTHQIIADLINSGAVVADISQKVFDTVSYQKVRLMGLAIGTLELLEKGRVSVISVTPEMMKEAGAAEEDCDGIVNLGRNIRGVEVALMLRQWENNEVKVNLRSNTGFDVASLAALYAGGGHKKAAGCIVRGSLPEVKKKLLKDIRENL